MSVRPPSNARTTPLRGPKPTRRPSASLASMVEWSNRTLRLPAFVDYPGAVNGLQVENQGRVHRIAAAVDASFTTVRKAVSQGANLLVVHHGLFWGTTHPWTGRRYALIRELMDSDMAVYSAHLPLDAHPRLGNNALLGRALGLGRGRPFFEHQGAKIGLRFETRLPRLELNRRMGGVLRVPPILIPGGPELCRQVGVITGGGGSEIVKVAQESVDTFVTGEGQHWTAALAEDLGVNLFYGGHYATETFGVKALAAALSDRFNLPWSFVDHPTGL